MKKIMVVTGTRAEYGLLKNVIRKIETSSKLELQLVVTGTHLVRKFGYTIKEIVDDGFNIVAKIDIVEGDGKSDIIKSMGKLMKEFVEIIEKFAPDILLVLGDRYEILSVSTVATIMNIPIAHIAGGEKTYGANDEQIRHAITKMAHIHFPEAAVYSKNIKNMGEQSFRIHQVGALGIENIKTVKLLNKQELYKELNILMDENTFLMTYHPTTLEHNNFEIDTVLEALSNFGNQIIVTYPNADNGGEYIIKKLEEYQKLHKNIKLVNSLGVQRYLSVMNLCTLVLGNSSSALIEAPYLKKPVINIGNRQEGRLMADNIICCAVDKKEIISAINYALTSKFKAICDKTNSLYGQGNTSSDIVKILEDLRIDEKLLKKKLEWE
ncbi:MAG: UDP-N-acetyl-D-glucosamine 2-epimerase, UDP-hydrolysing [Epulopiscium sp. Nuni2H_MBin003]|nr:MAG: UDP-N-acetyl-D-glucosamine 2-epimerase, UDP-hydrolysing [Epulopiscium sp. Nuni2H_MBin003]